MEHLDEDFLAECGLSALPPADAESLLQHLYEQLTEFVGRRLSEGLSDDLLNEFSDIVDRKRPVIARWIDQHAPDYRGDALYAKLATSEGSEEDLRAEYVATAWLDVNRPGYRKVVTDELDLLREKLRAEAPALLRAISAQTKEQR